MTDEEFDQAQILSLQDDWPEMTPKQRAHYASLYPDQVKAAGLCVE